MKLTVSFFNNWNKYIKQMIAGIKQLGSIGIFICLVVIIGIQVLRNPTSIKGIIAFATNIRQAEKADYTVKDIVKVYQVFNDENYIVKNVKSEVVNKKEEKPVDNDTSKFDASAVDAVSNIITIDKPNLVTKNTKNYKKVSIYGVTVYDYSSRKINYNELFKTNINLTKKSDPILLYATHTSESYANSKNFKFKYNGTYRSRNSAYNMLSVTSILANRLKEKGITTVFDTTPHDYTSYDNSYTNSMKTISSNIDKHSRFGISIDVHRDAAADLTFAPKTTINGKSTAKLMLVIGVGFEGYPNKYWKENLILALHIAKAGEEMYPGLFRQVLVRDSRYNQHLNEGSILVEVGATGNTLEEAYYGARCFANILDRVYK